MTPFAAGDKVLLIDSKKRRYLVTLRAGSSSTPTPGSSHTTRSSAGPRAPPFRSTKGSSYLALRPTLADFV